MHSARDCHSSKSSHQVDKVMIINSVQRCMQRKKKIKKSMRINSSVAYEIKNLIVPNSQDNMSNIKQVPQKHNHVSSQSTDVNVYNSHIITENEDLRKNNSRIMATFMDYKTRAEEQKLCSEEKISELDAQIESLNSIVHQHEQTIAQYSNDIKLMQIDKIKDADQTSKLRERIKRLEDELTIAKKDNVKLARKNDNSGHTHPSVHELQTTRIVKLQIENKDLQSKLSKAYSQTSSSLANEKNLEVVMEENEKLKLQLEDGHKNMSELQEKYNKLNLKYQKSRNEKVKQDKHISHDFLSVLPSRYRTITIENEPNPPQTARAIINNENKSLDAYFSLASARSSNSVLKQQQLEDLRNTLRNSTQMVRNSCALSTNNKGSYRRASASINPIIN